MNLGNPNHVQVLLEAFWGSAALSGSSPVVHMAQVVIWRDGKHALTPGEKKMGMEEWNSLRLCKNPQGVFSWCGYNLMIFFQNILFCTNLLKQLYIHFWRTVLKKKNLEKEGTMDLAEFHFSVHKILFRISNVASRRLSNKLCKNLYSCEPFHFIPICLILE